MTNRFISYQTKLYICLLLISCIPAVIIGITAYQQSYETLVEQTEKDLNVIVAQLSGSIEKQISDFDRFTMLPYYLPDIFSFLNKPYVTREQWGSDEMESQKTMARLMSAYPSINSSIIGLVISGMNGSLNGYRMDGDEKINTDEDISKQLWYQEAITNGGGFEITGLQEVMVFQGDPITGLVGSRMLRDDNYNPLGVISIVISPKFIPKLVQSLNLDNVQVTVLDQNRDVIYTSDNKLAEHPFPIEINQMKGNFDLTVVNPQDTTDYMMTYNKSEYLGWTIYMGVDRDEMLRGSKNIGNLTFFLVVFMMLIAVVVSWFLSRGLSLPIYKLMRSMRDVEKGVFIIPSSYRQRKDEIGQLENSYRRMVQRLEELIYSIEEKEKQKRNAELYAQRARIQPHFLYNTLNSIRMLAIIHQDKKISTLIQSLNKLLQANMQYDSELITLQDEIRLLQAYVELMDIRYTNVFVVQWDIDEKLKDALIPPMVLQVLVENAIFHGAKGLDKMLHITIYARYDTENGNAIVAVKDDGVGFDSQSGPLFIEEMVKERNSGIGLLNVRERIRLCFGDEYGLNLTRNQGKTIACLHFPYKEHQGS